MQCYKSHSNPRDDLRRKTRREKRRRSTPPHSLDESLCETFDGMRRATVKRYGRRGRAGRTSGTRGATADRLSALPDALLHEVMSSLKAWEVVRTCVLSQRWRHLWESAPCVDIRVRYSGLEDETPEEFRDFVHRLFLFRDVSASVDTLRLRSSDEEKGLSEDDANTWIRAAIKRNARVIHLAGHRRVTHLPIYQRTSKFEGLATMENVSFASCHLKILKLSYARLDEKILRQLSSSCTALEELDLKDCLVTGHEIMSSSLKTLTMLKCTTNQDFSIAAPNLVLLRLIMPYTRVPSFKNVSSLVIGTIILDDLFLGDDYGHISDEDDCDETTDDDDCDDDFEDITGFPQNFRLGGYKDNYNYGSDIDSDDGTYEYSEIAHDTKYGSCPKLCYDDDSQSSSNLGQNSGSNDDSKTLGGHNILQNLFSARSLELLGHAGEVVLIRELKRCPTFSNLKTLSLGEWCMAADFEGLVFLLQRSPNIDRLFLKLKLICKKSFNTRKTLGTGIKLKEKSFACRHLQMVKIQCSKDDARVHKLARLFWLNGIPFEKIYVRLSGSAYLRCLKQMKEFDKHELDMWGM